MSVIVLAIVLFSVLLPVLVLALGPSTDRYPDPSPDTSPAFRSDVSLGLCPDPSPVHSCNSNLFRLSSCGCCLGFSSDCTLGPSPGPSPDTFPDSSPFPSPESSADPSLGQI